MGKWAMLFPGQGSQYTGMGKELYDESETVRRIFEEADDTLGYKLSDIIMGGDAGRLTRTEYTQPALLTVGTAAYRFFMERIGGTPDYAAGHSLGEWTSLACAGAISFPDALKLVALRGTLMQEAADEGEGAMCAVIGLAASSVESVCLSLTAPGAEVVVSNYNSPVQTVISGRADAVRRAVSELERLGAKAVYLNVGAAFHSPLMASAAERLETAVRRAAIDLPRWPVLSNVTALPHQSTDEIARLLVDQIVSPVRWDATMRYLDQAGVTSVIELGPNTVLTRLAKPNAPSITAYSFEKPVQMEVLRAQWLPLLSGSSQLTRRFIAGCLTAAASTRNRNWDGEAYREGVIEPYRKLESIQERLDTEDRSPEPDEMREAVRMLIRICGTKGVPDTEIRERLHEIVVRTGTSELFPEYTGSSESQQQAAATGR